MESQIKTINRNILKLKKDVSLIKNIIVSERKLTDWAKRELAKAREEKEDDYTSLEET